MTRFATELKYRMTQRGQAIRLTSVTGGSSCPGAFDPHSGTYDPKLDRAYHQAHPAAPVCVNGILAAVTAVVTVYGLWIPTLGTEILTRMGLGQYPDADAVFYAPADVDFSVAQYLEFPVGSGIHYRIKKYQAAPFEDGDFFQYAVLERAEREV